jgi:hypothetical protein
MATTSSRGLKINTDGASREADKNGGWGYVIRDDGGRVIQSGSGRLRYAFSPLHMDLACVGVKGAMGLGIRDMSLTLQSKWWKLSSVMIFRLSILGGVVHELTENFFLPQIKFVSRECNRVAHELASIGSLGTEGRSARMYGDFSVQRFSWFGCLMESCIPLNKKKDETFQITNLDV